MRAREQNFGSAFLSFSSKTAVSPFLPFVPDQKNRLRADFFCN
jgi:hypothetical protein